MGLATKGYKSNGYERTVNVGCKKRGYNKTAARKVQSLNQQRTGKLYIYKCVVCKYYHITHMSPELYAKVAKKSKQKRSKGG